MDYDFFSQLKNLGVQRNDTILVHSSMKALKTTLSPKEFLTVLIDYLNEGTLILPTITYTLMYQDAPVFIANETPACIGLLPNEFLKIDGVKRSIHPTHSCAGIGVNADYLLGTHYLDRTPIGENSPFRKLAKINGKILMIGGVNEHNTLMHGVEEVGGAPYYMKKEPKEFTVIDSNGKEEKQLHFIHDFSIVKEVYYPRVESLLDETEISRGKIGSADCTLMSANAVLTKGVEKVKQNGWYFADKKE